MARRQRKHLGVCYETRRCAVHGESRHMVVARVLEGGAPRFHARCCSCIKDSKRRRHERDPVAARRQDWESSRRYRLARKDALLVLGGGACQDCGYKACNQALTFHHRNPSEKSFDIGEGIRVSWAEAVAEIEKCDLLCQNCHRLRHLVQDGLPTFKTPSRFNSRFLRVKRKRDLVDYKGGLCQGCWGGFHGGVFDFHHIDPSTKNFQVSGQNMLLNRETVHAEVDKSALLCANCHREVHAGVRTLKQSLAA